MNYQQANEIVKHGIIPGDFDSIDLGCAIAFLEGYEEAIRTVANKMDGLTIKQAEFIFSLRKDSDKEGGK